MTSRDEPFGGAPDTPWAVREGRAFSSTAATTVRARNLGPVQVVETRAHRAGDESSSGYVDPGDSFVWALITRGAVATKVGDEIVTSPGRMHVSYMPRVNAFRTTEDFRALSIRMDRRALALSSSEIDAFMQATFPAREGVPFLLGAVASQVMKMEGELGTASSGALARSILDLTAAFAVDFVGRRSAPETVRSTLVAAAHQHIESYSSNPALTSASVAAALQVSLRTLQKAFEPEGVTVTRRILECRLLRARGLLELEDAGAVSVAHLCLRSGFASASSFSRAFKAEYGLSPSEWRRRRAVDGGSGLDPERTRT